MIDDEQAEVVSEIFERFAAGESAKTIARELNERGIPSPGSYWNRERTNGWVHTTICGAHTKASGILRNPIYAGRVNWNKRKGKKVPGTSRRVQTRRPDDEWIEVCDESLRIVTDELFDRVQAQLEANRKRHGRDGRGRPNRYLLSGVLKCASCGASYVMANDRNYRCSSQTNGRASICEQTRVINRRKAEERLLEGIKSELLATKNVKAMAAKVRSQVKQPPDRAKLRAELARLDKAIENCIDSIAQVGGSEALHTRLRTLEADKARVAAQIDAAGKTARLVPNVEKLVRERLQALENVPREDAPADLKEKARAAVQDMLGGHVTVVEDGEHVVAEVDLGRMVYKHGAQERT